MACQTAQNRYDHETAYKVLYQSYLKSGLCAPNPWGMRIQPFHLWPETQLICGMVDGECVATVTLVIDENDRLPMEELFHAEVQQQRAAGRRMAELSSLAIAPWFERSKTEAFAKLTSAAVQFARSQGVDQLVATVHPRHAKLYKRLMGFEQFGSIAPHGGVLGKPAAPIAAPIHDPEIVAPAWRSYYFSNSEKRNSLNRTKMTATDRRWFFQRSPGKNAQKQSLPKRPLQV
ncbi:hypothetical protein NHH03_12265 [Stieleria sp. TO1_6]|uniref:N-acyl amino acid synthase FeeM domain-containing protein n=1 Tax=Stieleria tagensis TaxID=2956795 RepID=UPI00209A9AF1|nr:hypothetical protein [Stieleria tagensis]MCO8122514.1 hypothetical protein [Stieleria tagensis]